MSARGTGTPRPHKRGKVPKGCKPWPKGVSGNSKGAPKGRKWTRTMLMDALKSDSGDFLSELKKVAKRGNVTALKALLSPLIAQAQDNPVQWKWATARSTVEEIVSEGNAILDAVGEGKLTPRECEYLTKALERQRLALESATAGDRRAEFELDERILQKIRSRPKLFALAVRLLEHYQESLDADDLARAHPITVLPRAIAGGKPGGTGEGPGV